MNEKTTDDGWRQIDPGFPKPKPTKDAQPGHDAKRIAQDAERKIWRSFGN